MKQSNPGTTEPSTDASCTCGQVRLIGADRLRLATLLSIVFFHVVLTDLQFAHVTSAPDIAAAFDSLVVVSTVFDNRSLVILSFFLLFIRERDTPYASVVAGRAERLLLPYVAWSAIYPLLDFSIAAMTGQSQAFLARASHPQFWVSGLFLGTMKGHLHYLPTLFILTLLLPAYRMKTSLLTAVILAVTASILRTTIEINEYSNVDSQLTLTWNQSIILSVARIIEYCPLGILAFVLALNGAKYIELMTKSQLVLVIATTGFLIISSALIRPAQLEFFDDTTAQYAAWVVIQAVLGTVIMCLGACLVLGRKGSCLAVKVEGSVLEPFAKRSLGIFLVHPFFMDLFDAIVGQPVTYKLIIVIPKFSFVLVCSVLTSSILIHVRGLRKIV